MGTIKNIVDIVVPRAQKRIEEEGLTIKGALEEELIRIGYLQNKNNGKRN